MENLTFEIKNLYHRILIELLCIESFKLDYFTNKDIQDLFLLEKPLYFQNNKKDLLLDLQEINFVHFPDEIFFEKINYENYYIIEEIFSKSYSYFSDLEHEEKMLIIVLDLFSNSNLSSIFRLNTDISVEDLYNIISKELNISIQKIKKSFKKFKNIGIIEQEKLNRRICTTEEFSKELCRLSTIPSLMIFSLNDFEVINFSDNISNTKCHIESYTGENVTSYLYSKLNIEKIRFWYETDLNRCVDLLEIFYEDEIYNEFLWINNFVSKYENSKIEERILFLAEKTHTQLIISSENLERPFGRIPRKVISTQDNINGDYFHQKDDYSNFSSDLFLNICSEEEHVFQKHEITVIDEADYRRRYGANVNGFNDVSNINPRIIEIYQKLNNSCTYLTANRKMFSDLEDLINQHPNILNKDVLYAFIKNTILFSKDNILKTAPLLLVGNPGCGKSLFCRQLRQMFNQDNDIFIPMGSGAGITGLLGSTPEYKNASNGIILSSIWEAKNNTNCLNPLIILDEIEKACFSSKASDVNQNVYPTLLQLLGDENIKHFKDNFFEVPIKNFFPNFVCTANSIESIPKPLLDRITIIRFRDYTEDEFKTKIIPLQYESFRNKHNSLVPESLTDKEIEIIFKLSKGQTRQIQTAINRYLSVLFDIEGNRQPLDPIVIDNLLQSYEEICSNRQIGFCK